MIEVREDICRRMVGGKNHASAYPAANWRNRVRFCAVSLGLGRQRASQHGVGGRLPYCSKFLRAGKCWYIRADTKPSEQRAAQTAPEAPIVRSSQSAAAAVPYSLASFKTFMAQHGDARLSDQDVEKLYAEFLEWNRRVKN
jgi:hypothetical protein